MLFSLPLDIVDAVECSGASLRDNSTGQCVPACGDGTKLINGKCEPLNSLFPFAVGEIETIGVGIGLGILATLYGIYRTEKTRREEIKKEDLELIHNYGNKLSEIVESERHLSTKLDCTLYAERYLDTIEQVATLYDKTMLRDDVVDYFQNHFSYGKHLWFWYKKNVENVADDLLENYFVRGLPGHLSNLTLEEKKKYQNDRWYYFRWVCDGRKKELKNDK